VRGGSVAQTAFLHTALDPASQAPSSQREIS
jgi:hypothetical protein